MRARFLAALLLSLGAVTAHAQFKASIQGTVLDAKGAVIAGAKVTVASADTGLSRDTVTSAEGYYRVPQLAPGKYTVSVEAAGFRKFVASGVAVEAEQPRGFDVTLEVGAVTEQVTVTAAAAALQTENASVSTTISSQQFERLPQVGRDPYELLRLAPGVFGDGARSANGSAANFPNSGGPGGSNASIFSVENQVQVSANGQRNSGNNFMIDGTSVNSLTWGGAAILTPNQESIQEATVVANSYSAEDGRNTGAQIKIVSKNGTNEFHGSGFFKYDGPGLNSENKWGGPDGQAPQKVRTNLKQFGGSIGGPILKDKLFFFFSYEGDRTSDIQYSNPQYVETAALQQWIATNRSGTVVGDLLTANGWQPRIAQVLTPNCADFNSTWPAASACNVVNGGVDLGSPALSYGQYVTIFGGNTTGNGLDGVPDLQKVITYAPSHSSGNQYNGRVDYNHGKDLIAGSFYFTPLNSLGGDLGANGRPMADLTFDPRNKYVALIWNRTLSSTMTNEARVNWTRFYANQFATNPNVRWNLPRFEIEAVPGDRIKYGANQGTNAPGIFAQNQYEFRDTLSKLIGRHGLKTGFVFTLNQDNHDYEFGAARPVYVAHGIWNFVNGAPIYEGINVDPRTGAPTDVHKYYRQHDFAFFGQDDIKLRPNLTLNVGLRYEYFAPLTEKFGRQSNLILGSGSNALQTATLRVGGSLYPADRNNFAPRLGFSWSPSKLGNKTVIRGGFGVAYNRITDTMTGISRVNPPFLFREGACCAMSVADAAALGWPAPPFDNGLIVVTEGQSNNPLSWPANPAIAATFDPVTGLPLSGSIEIWGAPQTIRTPYVYLYSGEVQRELPGNLLLTVGYQGSQSRKMLRIVGLNRVFPQVNPVLSPVYFPTTDVNGHYNALLVSANRRFSHGLQFFGKYQFGRSMDGGSWEGAGGERDPFYPLNQTYDYGPSDFDVTHSMLLSAVYDIPVFKDRHDFAGKALGGWQVSGIFQYHSGFPWSPIANNNCPPIPAGGTLCPALPTAYLGKAGTDYSTDTLMKPNGNFTGIVTGWNCPAGGGPTSAGYPYFDVCTQGPPFIHRNSFRGPRYQTMDMSIIKSTPVPFFKGEQAKLDFRVNFFNLFNKLNLKPFARGANNVSINDSHFGQASGALAGRVIEFQARLSF
ncbi:MAG: TonB-dependent receptor [Acidobacteriia bacterium]|nr:TonB-dependent receptor [Terriglobia bacterium]